MSDLSNRISAAFWRMFREPVDLDAYAKEYGRWPCPLVEGDYYTSHHGQRFAITKGVWRPVPGAKP